jgi:hypothetical protein
MSNASSIGGGVQYATSSNPTNMTGTAMLGTIAAGNLYPPQLDANKILYVNIASGTINASNPAGLPTGTSNPTTGTLVLAMNGGTTIALSATSAGFLAVSQTNPGGAINGLVGVTGAVAVTSGSVTAGQTGTWIVGYTGTIAVSQTNPGGVVSQTGSWIVAFTGALPMSGTAVSQTGAWIVSSTIANPVNVVGLVGVTGSVAVSSGVINVNQTGSWIIGYTGTVAVSQTNPGGITSQTGTWIVGYTGTVPVSQTNPGGIVSQTASFIMQTSSSITGNITTVSVSMTGVQLLASNNSRKGSTFYNQSSNVLYLALRPTASIVSFTLIVAVSGYYEAPFSYNGAIWGVCGVSATTGLWYITELS